MLRVHRRIEQLEHALGVSDRTKHFVLQLNFVEGDGRVTGTMTMSSDPEQRVPYQDIVDGSGKEGE